VGRGGSNYLPVVAVVAPVLSAQFYRVFTEPPLSPQPMPSAPVSAQSQHLGGWGWNPQDKPSSINTASGSDLRRPAS